MKKRHFVLRWSVGALHHYGKGLAILTCELARKAVSEFRIRTYTYVRLFHFCRKLIEEDPMPPAKKDPAISALEAVHAALKPLAVEERQRVLASVHALLEMAPPSAQFAKTIGQPALKGGTSAESLPSRPVAIRELVGDKKPRTHPQFIALFAYYREKYQNLPTFSRDQLEEYYSMARQSPPSNYGRDCVEAIKRGWIHEDGDNSYITSKGIEAVESGFAEDTGAAKRTKGSAHAKKKLKMKKSSRRS